VGGIDDRATDGKWNPVRGGNPGGNVRFHVDNRRARLDVKAALFQGIRDRGVHSGNIGEHGARKRLKKFPSPYVIRGKKFLAGLDARSNDPIACSEIGRQSASNSKADDARSATPDRCLESGDELRTLIADYRQSGA
jgi:hypothetical protein